MSTQTIVYACIIYYVFLAIGIGVIGSGGLLDSTVSYSNNPEIYSYSANTTDSMESPPSTSTFGVSKYFSHIWNFAINWNVDLGVGAWVWVIRLLFVYLPVLFTILAIVYSLPFMGGH